MSEDVHTYGAEVLWRGCTGVGYDAYVREHEARTPPSTQHITLSGDEAFGGDPDHMNPEGLLVLAAASCQLLSFLAVAARARIDVREYRDAAQGTMNEEDHPVRIDRIVLNPHVVIGPEPSATEERVRKLVELAHRECYIANSLNFEVEVEPVIEFSAA